MAGQPLQIVLFDHTNTDLWSICAVGRFTYVTDRGRNCVHALSPVRVDSRNQEVGVIRHPASDVGRAKVRSRPLSRERTFVYAKDASCLFVRRWQH